MADKTFFENPHCVMCPNEIPAERRKFKAVTCSQECGDKWDEKKRERQDAKECRHCRKPSTPEQRAAYKRFRIVERRQPHLVYPAEFNQWIEDQLTFAQANKDPKKKFPTTPEAFAKHWNAKEKAA